jgi:hypothetical protein
VPIAPWPTPSNSTSSPATKFFPTQLPPLRGDAPTLVVGKLQAAKVLTATVEGEAFLVGVVVASLVHHAALVLQEWCPVLGFTDDLGDKPADPKKKPTEVVNLDPKKV